MSSSEKNKKSLLSQEIARSIEEAQKKKGTSSSVLRIDESQEEKLAFIGRCLGLSQTSTINACIKYIVTYIEIKKNKLEDLKEYPSSLSLRQLESQISIETDFRLQELELSNSFLECVVIGIEMLYERLSIEHDVINEADNLEQGKVDSDDELTKNDGITEAAESEHKSNSSSINSKNEEK